jgi:CrcB protein
MLAVAALVAVGVLGSFTTFSAFSLEVALLSESGQLALAGLYIGLSVVLCLVGFRFGEGLVRSAYRRAAR